MKTGMVTQTKVQSQSNLEVTGPSTNGQNNSTERGDQGRRAARGTPPRGGVHAIGSRHRAARAPSPSDQGNSTARGVHAIGSRHRAARAPAARAAPPRGETKAGAERPGELHREGRARYREPSPSGQVTQKEKGQHTWAVTERQEENQPYKAPIGAAANVG